MNYSKILLLSSVLSSIFIFSHESPLVQKTAVIQKAAVIKKQMMRERYIVCGLTALSMAQAIYPWIVLYRGSASHEMAEPKQLSFLEAIKAAFNSLFFTKEGWVSMVQVGCSQASAIVIAKVCDTFVHPDTLRWYVHAHACSALTIAMMQERLLIMQDELYAQEPLGEHTQYMQLLHNRLVQQGESVCAYMTYKIKRLDDEEKDLATRAVCSMFNAQNSWLQLIADQLSSDTFDYHIINSLLIAYEADIASQINHFSIIEGETLQERYVVKQLIKRSA